ncbi:MAG: GntR family transcriptional regulator [Lachnospiraceae bacterium]|jgi:DNA-binding GntR family transcriptional regulator|nr:GntR family transcriptional regulator [Lachnospiraceae bacterium]
MEEPLKDDLIRVELSEFLPLRDVVFNALRKAILTGRLKPGERLMEVHLGEQMGVSRTPIREAIRKLELEGLVVMVPRRGAEVAGMTVKSMQDVLEVRRSLDVLSVELACDRMSETELERLREAGNKFTQAIKTGNAAVMAEADVVFHDIIVAGTGNLRLQQLLNNLAEQIYRYRFVYLQDDIRHELLVDEHEAVYHGIRNRNKIAAVEAVRIHIDNQEQSIIRHIEAEKFRTEE